MWTTAHRRKAPPSHRLMRLAQSKIAQEDTVARFLPPDPPNGPLDGRNVERVANATIVRFVRIEGPWFDSPAPARAPC